MPDKYFNILSTGILSDELIQNALKEGLRIQVIPFYKITQFPDEEIEKTILDLSTKNKTVVFTSRHAVQAVICHLNNVPDWQIYCLNGATKKAVTTLWDDSKIVGEATNGKDLALKIIEQGSPEEIIFFCGEQRLDTLPQLLAAQNIALKEVVVYKTTPTPQVIKEKYDGILFFNPIGVHSFFSCNKTGDEILFSIGETTTIAITSHVTNTKNIITASQPCKELMVLKVLNVFKNI